MSEHPQHDELDAELGRVVAQPLHMTAVDPETGERVEGVVYADHLLAAIDERDEQP